MRFQNHCCCFAASSQKKMAIGICTAYCGLYNIIIRMDIAYAARLRAHKEVGRRRRRRTRTHIVCTHSESETKSWRQNATACFSWIRECVVCLHVFHMCCFAYTIRAIFATRIAFFQCAILLFQKSCSQHNAGVKFLIIASEQTARYLWHQSNERW